MISGHPSLPSKGMSARRPIVICLLAVLASACGSSSDAAPKTTRDIPTATVGELPTTPTTPDTTTSELDTAPTFTDPTVPFVPTVPITSTTSTTTTTIDPKTVAMCFSATLMPAGEKKVVVTFLDANKTLDDVRARASDFFNTLRALHDSAPPATQTISQSYSDATTLLIAQLNGAPDRQTAGAALDAYIAADHHFVRDILTPLKTLCPGLKADILVPPPRGTYENAGKAMDPPPDTTP